MKAAMIRDTRAWQLQVWMSFGIAVFLCAVGLAYLVIQQLEGHLLIPMLMKEGMDLPPALTIIAQAVMALLFGFLGLMVAVPLLAVIMVPIKMLYVEGVVGDTQFFAPDTQKTGSPDIAPAPSLSQNPAPGS